MGRMQAGRVKKFAKLMRKRNILMKILRNLVTSSTMLNWINTSKKQSIRRETESSDDDVDDTVDNEKDSFHNRVMRDSKSFLEIDNPFDVHSSENFKSVFAKRLSLTPRASRPASSSASTPKRSRSPSPTGVGGIKSIRKE